jgi:DNA-directed RNA polymerase specialized sigma24 family protein
MRRQARRAALEAERKGKDDLAVVTVTGGKDSAVGVDPEVQSAREALGRLSLGFTDPFAVEEISEKVLEIFTKVLELLAAGEEVLVVPRKREMSIAEAATLLDVSRSQVKNLARRGQFYLRRGRRGWVLRLEEVFAYVAREEAVRRKVLREIRATREGRESRSG